MIDLPSNYRINFTFNIEDLIAYKGPTVIPTDHFGDGNEA